MSGTAPSRRLTPRSAAPEAIADLARVSLAIAACDGGALDDALARCASNPGLDTSWVEEAILQSVPYSGFPGAIEALGRWSETPVASRRALDRRARATASGAGEPTSHARAARGRALFEAVYGAPAERVRRRLRHLHPSVEEWILDFAYGTVMASSAAGPGGLDLGVIEALGVASLLAQQRTAPLHSHLRGMVRNGWRLEDVEAFLIALAGDCPRTSLEFAREVLESLRHQHRGE